MGACHRTIDGQEHKISWRAGPEKDKTFHLRVTACREHARQWVGGKRGNGKTRERERKMQCSVHSIAQFSNRIFPFLFLSVISSLVMPDCLSAM